MRNLEMKDKILEGKIVKCESTITEEKKRKNLIIYGLGAHQGWKEREAAVFALFQDKIQVSCKSEDIDSIVKLDKNRDDGPILVKFTTTRKKLAILLNRKNLKGTNVYIDEDFNKEVVEKRKELKKIMKELKSEGKRQVYLRQDKLYVDGVLWSKEDEESEKEDVEMEDAATPSGGRTKNKRRRSPSDHTNGRRQRKLKTPLPLKNQAIISQFFNKGENPRARSSSTGAILGPEIAKIVDKLTAKDNEEQSEETQETAESDQVTKTISESNEHKGTGGTEEEST
uniref:Uncharacterized protein n=1 Tax=Cacopsylla melanoneura TaxID=428564 RepID=A0A8D8WY47_9HEMI